MISLILCIIAGISNAVMDIISFHFDKSVFKNHPKLSPLESWKNKYKADLKTPKFFLSTTLLVSLSDLWHGAKSLWLTSLFFAIILYYPMVNIWVDFIILRASYGIVFELFFSKILKSKS